MNPIWKHECHFFLEDNSILTEGAIAVCLICFVVIFLLCISSAFKLQQQFCRAFPVITEYYETDIQMAEKKQKSQVMSFFDEESGNATPHDLLQIINQWDISSGGSARPGKR